MLFGYVCMAVAGRTVARSGVFVQASLSHLGDTSKKSPRSFARILVHASKLSFEQKTISLRRDGLA